MTDGKNGTKIWAENTKRRQATEGDKGEGRELLVLLEGDAAPKEAETVLVRLSSDIHHVNVRRVKTPPLEN